ncbi:MAG TPA: hypothetical protein VK539_01830 [Myxococcaceae bacterium]|nr:hypothetical protein [Myxococcaceae bacterium]
MKNLKKSRAARRQRGQAMVEYSMINWVLVVALVISAGVKIRWTDKDAEAKNVIDLFLEAYQVYYDSYYYVLNLPFP